MNSNKKTKSPECKKMQNESLDKAKKELASNDKASSTPIPVFDVQNIFRGKDLYIKFHNHVLREEEFCAACTAALEIAEELEASPEVTIFSKPFQMARELKQYLLIALFRVAQKAEGIPDSLLFKMNLFHGFFCEPEYEGKRNFFACPTNIRHAEFFEYLPPLE